MGIDLSLVWAVIILFGVMMYVVMDGFDLGIGLLYPFFPRDEDRDVMMNTVAPVWKSANWKYSPVGTSVPTGASGWHEPVARSQPCPLAGSQVSTVTQCATPLVSHCMTLFDMHVNCPSRQTTQPVPGRQRSGVQSSWSTSMPAPSHSIARLSEQ